MNIQRLHEISEDLGISEIASTLNELAGKDISENCPIVIPLVGEFSAGKTTLINALTDNHQLETATKPTTATIYEIYFGCENCHAEVFDAEGNIIKTVDNIEDLKNAELVDASLVKVYDTAKNVPSSVVVVDTPGLSAPDPRHRQALVDYLPKADGVLLVSDVNQQLTASLLNFIKTATLANRPIYLALTMCDLKAPSEVESARVYASQVSGIPINHIACISAYKGDMEELYHILADIQKDKSGILSKVNEYRYSEVKNQLLGIISQMLETSEPGVDLSEIIRQNKRKLNSLKSEIEATIESVQSEIETAGRDSARKFEDLIFDQLDAIAASNGNDYDSEARALLDSTIRIMFNEYKSTVQHIISKKAKESGSKDDSISLSGLLNIDLSDKELGAIPYNLNLNALGHEYDSKITTGVKIAAAVALTAAVVSTGGAAAGAAGSAGGAAAGAAGTAASGAQAAGAAVQLANTSINAGQVMQAASALGTLKTGADFISQANDKFGEIEAKNHEHSERGALESLVGTITDRSLGKPQRRRAIHSYIDDTLMPSYKQGLSNIESYIVRTFSEAVQEAASARLEELESAMKSAQKEQFESEETYKARIKQLKIYQKEIVNL